VGQPSAFGFGDAAYGAAAKESLQSGYAGPAWRTGRAGKSEEHVYAYAKRRLVLAAQ
jgi:hypothetical protein